MIRMTLKINHPTLESFLTLTMLSDRCWRTNLAQSCCWLRDAWQTPGWAAPEHWTRCSQTPTPSESPAAAPHGPHTWRSWEKPPSPRSPPQESCSSPEHQTQCHTHTAADHSNTCFSWAIWPNNHTLADTFIQCNLQMRTMEAIKINKRAIICKSYIESQLNAVHSKFFFSLKKHALVIFCSMRPLVVSGEKPKPVFPPLQKLCLLKSNIDNITVQNSNLVFQPNWQPFFTLDLTALLSE